MKKVDFDELESSNERYADFEGEGFTGYAVEREPGYVSYRTFIRGMAHGPDYTLTESGVLVDFEILAINKPTVGAAISWNAEGSLASERIEASSGGLVVNREWDDRGNLSHEKKSQPYAPVSGVGGAGSGPIPWVDIPKISAPDSIRPGSFSAAVRVENLLQDADSGEYILNGLSFTGDVFYQNSTGEMEVRAVVDGLEEGRVFRWASTGEFIGQGVRRYPYGPVGPWHEWDEQGRLLREIIYDVLGNKIIHRELDESQNIVTQEHLEPAALMTDPETGERYPAPWL